MYQNIDDDYEEWENLWSALSEWFDSNYVDLDKLTEFVADEFITKLNQGHELQYIYLAEEVCNTVIPLPNGVGVSVLIVPGQFDQFDKDLQRAFQKDYQIMKHQANDPDE